MESRLNITFNGQNGDLVESILFDASDSEIKRVATEAVMSGSVPGITQSAPTVDFTDFVVDRFPPTENLPARCLLRPKTPFGVNA
jgi:hypothetical protein